MYEFAGNELICAPSRTGIRRTENNATPNPGGYKKTSFKQSKANNGRLYNGCGIYGRGKNPPLEV